MATSIFLSSSVTDLRKELQKAEAKASIALKPISRLENAESELREAERLLRLNIGQRAEIESYVAGLELQFRRTEPLLEEKRGKLRGEALNLRDKFRTLVAEAEKLEKEIQLKQIAALNEQRAIAQHPVYAAAREEQNSLLAEGLQLFYRLHRTPLGDLQPVMQEITKLIQKEFDTINRGRANLRRAGLPELRPRLQDFFSQAVPLAELEIVLAWDSWPFRDVLEQVAKQEFRG